MCNRKHDDSSDVLFNFSYLTFIHIESILVHTSDTRLQYFDTYIDDNLLNKNVHENKNN